MAAAKLGLVERLLAALRKSGRELSASAIALEHFGMAPLDESLAARLVDPLLASDPRFERGDFGWRAARVMTNETEGQASACLSGSTPLDAPFVRVVAPFDAAIAHVEGSEAQARFTVALGGESEVQRAEALIGRPLPRPALGVVHLARRLAGYRGREDAVTIAEKLGIPHLEGEDAKSAATLVATLFEALAARARAEGATSLEGLEELVKRALEGADFKDKRFGPEELLALGEGAGVYVFSDDEGVLYVGSSTELGRRVRSYFVGPPRDDKDRTIRARALELRVHECATGPDAWLLERRLIARLAPRLNTKRASHPRGEATGVVFAPPTWEGRQGAFFVLRGGGLAGRVSARRGPRLGPQSAGRALALLLDEPPSAGASAEEGALLETWRRAAPREHFVELGVDGGRDALAKALEALARAAGED